MSELLKLNLGSGQNPRAGFINVDKFGAPDVLHDLETFPWPWTTNSVGEVLACHVLEHLGATTELYFGVVKELYRVCAPGALITIVVPHPRSDSFLSDPTHVRVVTPGGLALFSKASNKKAQAIGAANTPLASYLDVDFELVDLRYPLDEPWLTQLANQEISPEEIMAAIRKFNNVAKEIHMALKVIKTPG